MEFLPGNESCFVVHLEKVILLHIMPSVKDSFFTSLLVVYETFGAVANNVKVR